MSFKRLAIQTKKSLSGLYSFNSDQVSATYASGICLHTMRLISYSSDIASSQTSPVKNYAPYACDEFSTLSAVDYSPSKDSPSKCKRLLGSLRSMGSLRSIRSNHHQPRIGVDLPNKLEPELEGPQTPIREMPSLTLNFEVSPPDQPMFSMRKMCSSSSIIVHRLSPTTVPTSARQLTPTFDTPPDFPAPLQRTSVQQAILSHAADAALVEDAPSIGGRMDDTILIPLEGIRMSLKDSVAPGIFISSLSAPVMHPNVTHSDTTQECFSINSALKNSRKREDSLVTTSDLDPTADAEIMALLAMTTAPTNQPIEAACRKLESVHSHEALSTHSDGACVFDSTETLLSEGRDIGGDATYIVWEDPAVAAEDKYHHERNHSAWNRHSGVYGDTGYSDRTERTTSRLSTSQHTKSNTETTDLTVPDEEPLDAKVVATTIELVETSIQPEVQMSADDKDTLQDIIRAYASPMLYHEETEAHHALEHSDDFSQISNSSA
jgi:hypothetical protein